MKTIQLLIIFSSFFIFSCKNNPKTEKPTTTPTEKKTATTPNFQNKGHELIYKMTEKVGTYNDLLNKKDVVYTYTYETPDGKKDVSTEKYIFNNELSYGKYENHQRTFPDLEGTIEQGYDGKEYWLKHKSELINDEDRLKRVAFNRPTNFYWFTMFQKLLDPDLTYEYLGDKTIDNKAYDVVKVGFNTDKPSDIYQVYINKETNLIDQFLFTVADFGVMDTPRLMKVEYEEVDGFLIPSKRIYKKSNWNADVSEDPWINVNWSNIKFDNNLEPKMFTK